MNKFDSQKMINEMGNDLFQKKQTQRKNESNVNLKKSKNFEINNNRDDRNDVNYIKEENNDEINNNNNINNIKSTKNSNDKKKRKD